MHLERNSGSSRAPGGRKSTSLPAEAERTGRIKKPYPKAVLLSINVFFKKSRRSMIKQTLIKI
jgi:hypothetical protein